MQASIGSLIVSACVALGGGWLGRPAASWRVVASGIGAVGAGLASGYLLLGFGWVWPPAKALDRLLELILPAALVIEFAAGMPRISPQLAWGLRIGLAAATSPVLLYGSVYLRQELPEWNTLATPTTLLACGVLLALYWLLLVWLAQRRSGVSIAIAISMATQCAGATIMLAGYIKGGMAAGPLAVTIATTAIVANLTRNRAATQSILGVGILGLFGLLFIGRFYGGLRTPAALLTFLTPLLCWVTEIRAVRDWKDWQLSALRLTLITLALALLLALAKRDFDRDFAPLLR